MHFSVSRLESFKYFRKREKSPRTMPYIKRTTIKTHIPKHMKIIKNFLFTNYSLVFSYKIHSPYSSSKLIPVIITPSLIYTTELRTHFIPFLYLSFRKNRKKKEEEEEKFKSYLDVMIIPNLNFFENSSLHMG